MDEIAKKHGLVYTSDLQCVVGIDSSSSEFDGVVPTGPKRIEEEAFSCCSIKQISLPESVVEVGANLFCNSVELESVKLPTGLKQLSPYMFCGCKALEKIEMPYEVEDFPEGLFAECTSLKEIPFRSGVKNLKEGVFAGCTALVSLVLPDTVEKVFNGAVTGCSSLRTLVLSAHLKEFEDGAVQDCPLLSKIRISDANEYFCIDEAGEVLFRKNPDGSTEKIFEVPNKVQSEVPGMKELDDTENPSVVVYDEEDDESFDENEVILSSEEVIEDTIKSDSEEEKMSDMSDMDAKLAEIMGQDKQYDEGDFNIMDIPEASEEEMEASKLASSEPSDESAEISIPEYEPSAEVTNEMNPDEEKSMDAKLAEIMGQHDDADSFSIMDIPAASEDELAADRLVSEGDFAPGVEDADSSAPAEAPQAQETDENEEKIIMQNLFFESDKVLQQKLEPDAEEEKILFVFAEELSDSQFGKAFSTRLQKCCNRLAMIHKFTSIFYFNGVDVDNEKFRGQFSKYMEDKAVVIACNTSKLNELDEKTKVMAEITNVQIDLASIKLQAANARDPDGSVLKLLIKDNLAE